MFAHAGRISMKIEGCISSKSVKGQAARSPPRLPTVCAKWAAPHASFAGVARVLGTSSHCISMWSGNSISIKSANFLSSARAPP